MQMEQALQTVDADVSVPYWDWTVDASLLDPAQSALLGR